MIYSVVDKKRYGLICHSDELQTMFGAENVQTIHTNSLSKSFKTCVRLFFAKDARYVVVWNIGYFFIMCPLLRLRGICVLYTKHEPDNFRARYAKTGQFFRSILQHILVEYYSKFFTINILFNEEKCKSPKDIYLPLNFSISFIEECNSCSKQLVFLGAKLHSRQYDLIEKIYKSEHKRDFEIVFFPSYDEPDRSEQSKIRLIENGQSIIWNFFNVPYNQSGVSVDALRYGVPIILSDFDKQIPDNGLTFNLDWSEKNHTDIIDDIELAFANYDYHKEIIRNQAEAKARHVRHKWSDFFSLDNK